MNVIKQKEDWQTYSKAPKNLFFSLESNLLKRSFLSSLDLQNEKKNVAEKYPYLFGESRKSFVDWIICFITGHLVTRV